MDDAETTLSQCISRS